MSLNLLERTSCFQFLGAYEIHTQKEDNSDLIGWYLEKAKLEHEGKSKMSILCYIQQRGLNGIAWHK
jgi:hypothetical protein